VIPTGAPIEGIIDGRVFEVLIPLPEAPAGGNRLSGVRFRGNGGPSKRRVIGVTQDFAVGGDIEGVDADREGPLHASGEPETLTVVAVLSSAERSSLTRWAMIFAASAFEGPKRLANWSGVRN
jgi:hypothetical protein